MKHHTSTTPSQPSQSSQPPVMQPHKEGIVTTPLQSFSFTPIENTRAPADHSMNPLILDRTYVRRLDHELFGILDERTIFSRNVSERLRSFTSSEAYRKPVESRLRELVNGLQVLVSDRGDKPDDYLFQQRAIACLTSDGRVFFGVFFPHPLPGQTAHAMEGVHAAMAATGTYKKVIHVTLCDAGYPSNDGDIFYDKEQRLLISHRHPAISSLSFRVIGLNGKQNLQGALDISAVGPLYNNKLPPFPGAEHPLDRPLFGTLNPRIPRILSPEVGEHQRMIQDILRDILRESIRNSNADGRARPGRKEHTAVYIMKTKHGVFYVYGVQVRANDPQNCFCAERNAGNTLYGILAARAGGVKMPGVPESVNHRHLRQVSHSIVFSPRYLNGAPHTCAMCESQLRLLLPSDGRGIGLFGIGQQIEVEGKTGAITLGAIQLNARRLGREDSYTAAENTLRRRQT